MSAEGIYTPFQQKDEIRLFTLLPGLSLSPIHCSLQHACLSSQPTYDALSYTWGQDKNTNVITINGQPHLIRKNLYHALGSLRQRNETRVLWIDALCINQSDDGERGHQVSQMSVIYRQARTVRIWLGHHEHHTENLFMHLINIHSGTGRVTRDKEIIAEFGRLCSREYWERLWIIQEIMLASRLDFHCGELTLPWKCLEAAVLENAWVLEIVHASSGAKLCRKKVAMKPAGRASETATPGASLLSLVILYAEAKCADARDKLYGLHSFAPDCCREAIPIDYSRSAYDICQRLLQHEIACHDFKMPSPVLSIAFKIHGIFVGGALGQPNSTFEPGSRTCQQFGSNHPQRKIMSRIQAVFDGDVCWVSSPLRDLWRGRQDMWVPREVLHTPIRMTFHAILARIGCVEATQEAGSVVPIGPESKSSSWRMPLVPTFESRSNGRS